MHYALNFLQHVLSQFIINSLLLVPHELPVMVLSPANFIINNESGESSYPCSDTGKVSGSYGGLDHVQDLTLITIRWKTIKYVTLLFEEIWP